MESVALVTGGARGVGAAVARALAARGHTVAIHCHASLREARELAAELTAAGGRALAVTANFREEGAVRAMVHRVADAFGRIDIVAGCAARQRPGRLEELAGVDLAADYEVNVIGPFVVAQEAAAVMIGQPEGGRIVALAAAGRPDPDAVAYAASQGAIPALMESLDAACRARHPRVRAGCLIGPDPLPEPAVLATLMLERIDALWGLGNT
jgi:NAD(P)-dependent dehydrogenase (short-subunit alcohol dehydrogenase family)